MLTDKQIRIAVRELIKQAMPITSMKGLQVEGFVPGKSPVQYAGPNWEGKEIEEAVFALLRGKWLSSGEKVREFEESFAKTIGKKHSIMCNSGSSANLLMLSALKSKKTFGFEGIEVITPAVCFPTTIAPILQCGFKPKFVDVEMNTLNLDLGQFEKSITSKTKAVVFAHVLGNPPDMDKLQDICREKKIMLLEDSCDALGSYWGKKPIGSFGLMSTHSFYPAHHITTGEGGMVSTDDETVARTVRSITCWGRACACVGAANVSLHGSCGRRFYKWLKPAFGGVVDHKYIYDEIGYNLKPLDLQGAVGSVQLKKLGKFKKARQKNFQKYDKVCAKYPELVKTVKAYPKADVNWFGFPITVVSDKFSRNDFVSFLEERKIQTRNYFSGNILFHPPYAHLGNPYDYPNACKVMENTFFIGVQPRMSKEMSDFVSQSLNEFLSRYD